MTVEKEYIDFLLNKLIEFNYANTDFDKGQIAHEIGIESLNFRGLLWESNIRQAEKQFKYNK